jgi:hypothetical protein
MGNDLPASEPAGRLCRVSLIAYIKAVAPWFQVQPVHYLIATRLEALAHGGIDRLMIFLPPRSGKSTMTSVFYPAWWAGNSPSDKIMQVGYKTDLSRRFSRETMRIIRSSAYQIIFPGVRISKDAHSSGQ